MKEKLDYATLVYCLCVDKRVMAEKMLELTPLKAETNYEIKLRDEFFSVGIKGKHTTSDRSRNFPYYKLSRVVKAINADEYLQIFGIKTEKIS